MRLIWIKPLPTWAVALPVSATMLILFPAANCSIHTPGTCVPAVTMTLNAGPAFEKNENTIAGPPPVSLYTLTCTPLPPEPGAVGVIIEVMAYVPPLPVGTVNAQDAPVVTAV